MFLKWSSHIKDVFLITKWLLIKSQDLGFFKLAEWVTNKFQYRASWRREGSSFNSTSFVSQLPNIQPDPNQTATPWSSSALLHPSAVSFLQIHVCKCGCVCVCLFKKNKGLVVTAPSDAAVYASDVFTQRMKWKTSKIQIVQNKLMQSLIK